MIDDELLAKFDRIQDLPVSEEMLGAYFEGNLGNSDSELVSNAISHDLFLMNLSHEAEITSEVYEMGSENPDVFFHDDVIDLVDSDLFTDVHETIESSIPMSDDLLEIDNLDFNLPDIDYFLSDSDEFETDSFE